MHQIGEVADAVGLSLRTIRYYDEAGLVPPSGRSAGGFRLYTVADIDRLRLVKHMKPLDLTIEEMRDLLTTRDRLADPTTPRANAARSRSAVDVRRARRGALPTSTRSSRGRRDDRPHPAGRTRRSDTR
jgi:MerR family transcriptional regulator, copper efflux regulator